MARQQSSIGTATKQSDIKIHAIPPKRNKEWSGSEVELKEKLSALELEKYCAQKLFNVLFINETDEYSKEVLSKIINMSVEFENISYLTFITQEDVMKLLMNNDNAVLPPLLKSFLITISKKVNAILKEEGVIPLDCLGQLVKLKLIEVMYTQYVKAVKKMQQRRKLMTDLKILADQCRLDKYKEKTSKKVDSKTNMSKSDLVRKSKTLDVKDAVDYTTIPIQTDDDIVFDDDIHHHVSFYIFSGFYEPKLLKELIINNVPIQSILKFTAQPPEENNSDLDSSSIYSDFWRQVNNYFHGTDRQEFTENTFLMNYNASKGTDTKQMLEELLSVVRKISDIKLQHLNYLRHMKVFRDKEVLSYFPLECLTVYNNFLQKIPMELVNIPVLLDSLLKQVSLSVDEILPFSDNLSQHSYLELNNLSNERNRCIDPCSFEAFLKRRTKVRSEPSLTLKKLDTSFLVHENDELTLILNSYKKYGPLVNEISLRMLKYVNPLKDFWQCEDNYTEIIHKHGRDPSTKTTIENHETLVHFMYLFLFSCFGYKQDLPQLVENELIKNLESYHKLDFLNRSRPKIMKSGVDIDNQEVAGYLQNLYDCPVTDYYWKEKLEPTVLLQEVFKAHKEYLYCHQRYSPETETLLIQYTNGLDEFGLNTKIYDQPLPTTVCLRDFCRYDIVRESEWLTNHRPPKYVRKCVVKEQCDGAQKINTLNLFPEYHHLLETGLQEEPETSHNVANNKDYEEISFEDLVDLIKYYPPNTKIAKECTKDNKPKFLVYDLGTKYFQVKGARTTFQSHDNVTITVDNTKLYNEYPKCSVTLNCKNNSLVLHSGKFYLTEDYNFHINLADGTIISYAFLRQKKPKPRAKSNKDVDPARLDKKHITTLNLDKPEEVEYADNVLSVDKDYFENVIQTSLLNEEFDSSERITFKASESILERLKDAATTNVPIYKVNNNLNYLKKTQSEFVIPLSNIVKRLLHTTVVQKEGPREQQSIITRRYLSQDERSHEVDKPTDIRIALPNGLYITFYPSQLKKGYLEVKQEFLIRNEATEQEEFRLFTRGGYNLIKKIDGCITTLKSNGDLLKHEKLSSEAIGKSHLGLCHCKTVQDYIKRVNRVLKHNNEEASFYAISRRAHLRTRKGSISSPDTISILMNNKIPYLKHTSLKFDGSRVCLESGKVRIKKVLHTSFENNFPEQEIYFERGDGFKSTFDKHGSQMVEFDDGTKITSSVHVEKNLVDGYVYISLQFKFEHPNYATVFYTSQNDLEVHLNNNVLFKLDLETSSLIVNDEITTTVDKNKILFEKSCTTCNSKFTCDINIQPLVKGNISFSDVFLHAQDSYNKHFLSDYIGNCQRNDDYIKGPFNSLNCNHYSRMSYKKLFVVNRNLSGDIFWTNKMVLTKKTRMANDPYCTLKEVHMATTKIPMYKFKKQIFDHYSSRFVRRTSIDQKQSIYSTFCVIKRMIDEGTFEKYCVDLAEYFMRSENDSSPYYTVLEKMIRGRRKSQQSDEIIIKETQEMVHVEKCKCVKEKLSISDKIDNWKNECRKFRALLKNTKVPCYFDSPFCKITKRK